ncbi:group 10 secretory phospholipase A2 [Carcharodon carcharias]|uniref:group 10 secretory phospholipase A2 n=1 Tax=Carcharodon carcharias TaxID=13397 RepID=UPI001B7DFFDE|nr:group 10 secretory phospholipase A2 [Carcharodon carcharias]
MESLLFGLFLLLSVHVTAMKEHRRRQARSVFELVGMIQCSTDRSVSYLMYGCYCGIGGKGWPRDGTDWCCFSHDCCYEKAEKIGCHPKAESYDWYCKYGTPRCGIFLDHCERMTCECDMKLSNCLKKTAYQKRYALWPNFLCGRRKPQC